MAKRPKNKYWERRFVLLQEEALKPADDYLEELQVLYTKMNREIEEKMAYWTRRFAVNNEVTMAEAKRLLQAGELQEFKWTLEEYAKRAAAGSPWAKEVENASARVHISRLEAMRLDLKGIVEDSVPEDLRWLFEDIYERAYYGTGWEVAHGFDATFPMQKIDEKALDRVMRKPWTTDGRTFSDRLWTNKTKLINELQTGLAQGLIMGKSSDKLIRNLQRELNTSYANASRIVRTESAFFSAVGDLDAYKALDVEKYQILATLDTRTSDICRDMDLKIFDRKDYEIGVTASPFHPNCRTTTVHYDMDLKDIDMRAARDKNGKTVMVRGDMGYKEWKEWIEIESIGIGGFKDRPNTFVVDRVLRGEYGHKINKEKQDPHMESTADPSKSFLFDSENPQDLFDRHAGTGIMEIDKNGNLKNTELCAEDHNVGIDKSSGLPTNTFKIHHSKNRTHISPYKKRSKS